MISINHPNLTPLLRLYIKETDTQEIVDLAMEIAEKHQYPAAGMGNTMNIHLMDGWKSQ